MHLKTGVTSASFCDYFRFKSAMTRRFSLLPPQTPASAGAAPGTLPLQNCELVESKLRKHIQGCWRQFLKECKERDTRKQGEIAASEFLGSFWFCSLGNSVPSWHQAVPAVQTGQSYHW